MYKYKVVPIKYDEIFGETPKDYQEIINQYAKQGWRLIQIIHPESREIGFETEVVLEKYMED